MSASAHHSPIGLSPAASVKPVPIPVVLVDDEPDCARPNPPRGRLGRWLSQTALFRAASSSLRPVDLAAAAQTVTSLPQASSSAANREAISPPSVERALVSSVHKHKVAPPPLAPSQDFYPTPPQSPDLVLQTQQLPCTSRFGFHPVEFESVAPPASSPKPVLALLKDCDIPPAPKTCPVPARPIELDLTTPHALPHARGLRLVASAGVLGAYGGNKRLSLDTKSIWDRMPYSPVTTTTTIMSPRQPTDDHLADGFGYGGESSKRPLKTMPDHISSIFVHPPTPERDAEPPALAPPVSTAKSAAPGETAPTSSLHLKGIPSRASPRASPMNSPRIEAGPFVFGSPARGASASLPTQVLPEVRSPPRRPLMMHADSLTVTRRGRRPKLFGFTELPESSSSASSANSSLANSRSNSPERHAAAETAALPSPLHFSTVPSPPQPSVLASGPHRTASGPGPSGSNAVLPRRPGVRAKSAESLPTLNVTESAPSPPPQHIPPRRRENGLKLDFTGIVPIATAPTSGSQSARIVSPYTATLIRKKSGEVVKSALKSAGPLSAAGTPLSDSDRPIFESKSCPTTPSCPKYVHFDSQLERVKLFLHDQKPQNVSRDGSPHHDWTTSDGEEYPFPPTDEEREKETSAKVLQISLPNFPTSHPPDAELYLESLFLDDDRKTLKGMIMCKNLSFQKWVAVRFTLDWWQTTSEVSATHKESVRGGTYDRFAFAIKLQDLMNKIEDKTLFLAIRFNIDGREIWDSNGGQNYQVTFAKVAPPPTKLGPARAGNLRIENGMGRSIGGKNSQWSVHGRDNDDRMADLRARLNRLTADDPDAAPKLSPTRDRTFAFSPRKNTLSFGGSPQSSPRKGTLPLDGAKAELLPGAGPALAARYDFNAAFKGSKDARRGSNSPNSSNTDLAAMRTGLLSFAETNKRNGSSAAVEFFSPRSTSVALPTMPAAAPKPDAFFSAPPTFSSDRLSPTPSPTTGTVPSPRVAGGAGALQDVPALHVQGPSPEPVEIADPLNGASTASSSSLSSSAAPTPPSPRPSLARARTSPAVLHSSLPDLSGGSPPQLDGSSSATDTPTDSPRSPPDVALAKWSPSSKSDSSDVSLASMNSFIEQFCWAGDGSGLDNRRTHSTSALDQYFASAHSPSPSGTATPRPTHHHSGSDSFTYSPASSTTSYYTAYSGGGGTGTGTGTPRSHELDEVEGMLSANAGRRSVTPTAAASHRRPERAYATGNMSPPIFC